MYDWMDWLNLTKQATIKHKMNQGKELRIGPYLVDGYCPNTGDLYEFLGCFFHGHSCLNWKNKDKQRERYERTMRRITFLEQKGYTVHFIWQCEFKKQIDDSQQLKQFITNRRPAFYRKYPQACKESHILESVVKDEFFGFLEVDIQIPDTWDQVKYIPQTNLSPRDYFDEMASIFCTSEIPFQCIGKHMTEHARNHKLSKSPRSLLVGGLRAKKILLFSPLLKWYILQGLLVTDIYEIVEYRRQSCFSKFVDYVANARREGDRDKSKEIIGILCKLLGNSAFGSCIMSKENFLNIKYLGGSKKAAFAMNTPRFLRLNELSDEIYEAEFYRTNILMNMPIQIGFAVLD